MGRVNDCMQEAECQELGSKGDTSDLGEHALLGGSHQKKDWFGSLDVDMHSTDFEMNQIKGNYQWMDYYGF